MKGYKAFEKGMICKGKQYAEKTVFEEESAEICKSGMHFCKNPLDVLDYYPLVDENGKEYYMPAISGQVVNTVGAGDSMVAGFLAGYTQKADYGYALKLGTAAGGATAFCEGLATRDEIFRLMSQMQS